MTPQERDLLIQMFQRIDAAGDQPRDREAEELIADGVRQLPFAPYLLAQTVLVQEEALKAAGARIEELEAQLRNQSEPPQGGSFLGSGSALSRPSTSVPTSGTSPWGRNARDAIKASPQPMQQPIPQQPMPQAATAPQSGGFLRGALGAAAGVAGGMLLANSIRGLFDHGNNRNDQLGIGSGLDRDISSANSSGSNAGVPDMSDIFPASGSSDDSYSSDYDSSSDDTSDI